MLQYEHISRFRFDKMQVSRLNLLGLQFSDFGNKSISKFMHINLLAIQYINTGIKEGKTYGKGTYAYVLLTFRQIAINGILLHLYAEVLLL